MKRYEYKIIKQGYGSEEVLNDLANLGWRLVTATCEPFSAGDTYLYFERQRPLRDDEYPDSDEVAF